MEDDNTKKKTRRLLSKDRTAPKFVDENPCLKESGMSLKCLEDNDMDRDKCSMYFKNYRNCLDFWLRVRRDRKSHGIVPHLPKEEDRPSIKAEYYEKWSS